MTGNVVAPLGGADLEKLTRDLNQIDRTRDDHVYQLGLKLIPIRQLLQQMNGKKGPPGADGLCPVGWLGWCDSAGIAHQTASNAVNRAVDPQGHKSKRASENRDANAKPYRVIRECRRAWPGWTAEDRAKVIAAVRQLAQETNRAA